MLPSDMYLNIRSGTVGYNNKILVSDGKFNLGKNHKINASEAPAMKSHKYSNVVAQISAAHKDLEQTAVTHKDLEQKPTITHSEEKAALTLFLTGALTTWFMFR